MRFAWLLLLPACNYLGGAVSGAPDTHCKDTTHTVSACVSGATTADIKSFGDTNFGTQADDDDCKYHLTYSYSPIQQKKNVTFALHLTNKADGSEVSGAAPLIEAYIANHSITQKGDPTETAPGHYTTAPIMFDTAGTWTVRFHFFESCAIGADSPHGHAAFYIRIL